MLDKLEHFVSEHKEEFDNHDLPDHLWDSIHKRMQQTTIGKKHHSYWAIAASVLLIVASGIWYIQPSTPPGPLPADADIKPEVMQAEQYYAGLVQSKRKELKQYAGNYPELWNGTESEITKLDTAYNQLKKEYTNPRSRDAVTRAMIQNLQIRVEILDQQLLMAETLKNGNASS